MVNLIFEHQLHRMFLNLVKPHLDLKLRTNQPSLIQAVSLEVPIAKVHDSRQITVIFSVNIYGQLAPVLLIYAEV